MCFGQLATPSLSHLKSDDRWERPAEKGGQRNSRRPIPSVRCARVEMWECAARSIPIALAGDVKCVNTADGSFYSLVSVRLPGFPLSEPF